MFKKMSDLEKISAIITVLLISIVGYDVISFCIDGKVAIPASTMVNYIIGLLPLLILSVFFGFLAVIDESNKHKKNKK